MGSPHKKKLNSPLFIQLISKKIQHSPTLRQQGFLPHTHFHFITNNYLRPQRKKKKCMMVECWSKSCESVSDFYRTICICTHEVINLHFYIWPQIIIWLGRTVIYRGLRPHIIKKTFKDIWLNCWGGVGNKLGGLYLVQDSANSCPTEPWEAQVTSLYHWKQKKSHNYGVSQRN